MSLYDEAASDCLFNQLVNHHLFQWLDGNDGSPAFFFPGLTKKSVGYSVLRANWFRVSRLQPRPFDGSPVALDLVWFSNGLWLFKCLLVGDGCINTAIRNGAVVEVLLLGW